MTSVHVYRSLFHFHFRENASLSDRNCMNRETHAVNGMLSSIFRSRCPKRSDGGGGQEIRRRTAFTYISTTCSVVEYISFYTLNVFVSPYFQKEIFVCSFYCAFAALTLLTLSMTRLTPVPSFSDIGISFHNRRRTRHQK